MYSVDFKCDYLSVTGVGAGGNSDWNLTFYLPLKIALDAVQRGLEGRVWSGGCWSSG